MEQRELTCINCPLGCQLTVTLENGAVAAVAGNGCPRGDRYARDEVCHPMRMLTSTVPVRGGALRRVSVKTAAPIPRERIFAAMAGICFLVRGLTMWIRCGAMPWLRWMGKTACFRWWKSHRSRRATLASVPFISTGGIRLRCFRP